MERKETGARSADSIDIAIGRKISQLRLAQGLARQDLANLVGVTHQQLHKYERGINRISAGRLVTIAQALNISVGYFFEDTPETTTFESDANQRLCMELMRDFLQIKDRAKQEAVRHLVKSLIQEQS